MEGIQKTAAEGLRDLARRAEEGAYGQGDEFDVDALQDDLDDLTVKLE